MLLEVVAKAETFAGPLEGTNKWRKHTINNCKRDQSFKREQRAFCHSLCLSHVYKIKHTPMQSGYNSVHNCKNVFPTVLPAVNQTVNNREFE